MKHLYAVYFETDDGTRLSETQRVYATDQRDAMIEAGAVLAMRAPAIAVVRVLA